MVVGLGFPAKAEMVSTYTKISNSLIGSHELLKFIRVLNLFYFEIRMNYPFK